MSKNYKVEMLQYDNLNPDEKDMYCNEDDMFLRITDKNGSRLYSDGMESEDATFFRDLSWIQYELEKAYNQGRLDQIFFEKSKDKD